MMMTEEDKQRAMFKVMQDQINNLVKQNETFGINIAHLSRQVQNLKRANEYYYNIIQQNIKKGDL